MSGTPVAWVDPATLDCITDVDARAGMASAAQQLLADTTGVGLYTDTARPCYPSACAGWSRWDALYPGGWTSTHTWPSGMTQSFAWNGHAWDGLDGCGCSYSPAVRLPGAVSVEEVVIDGGTIAPTQYLLDGDWLYRIDGDAWPGCQALNAPEGMGTFVVNFTRGSDPGEAGRLAAKQLACALYRFDNEDATLCGLPANVRQVTRQGVTFDLARWLEDGKATGLPLVDVFLATYRRGGVAVVFNPDAARTRGRIVA